MEMREYAQHDAVGRVFSVVRSGVPVTGANIVPVPDGVDVLGMVWNGANFVPYKPGPKELAIAVLADVDQKTGVQRAMREALLIIGDKIGADLSYLRSEEARAAAARAALK